MLCSPRFAINVPPPRGCPRHCTRLADIIQVVILFIFEGEPRNSLPQVQRSIWIIIALRNSSSPFMRDCFYLSNLNLHNYIQVLSIIKYIVKVVQLQES